VNIAKLRELWKSSWNPEPGCLSYTSVYSVYTLPYRRADVDYCGYKIPISAHLWTLVRSRIAIIIMT